MSSVEELGEKIKSIGDQIREKKVAKAPKEEVEPLIAALLAAKEAYKAANGGVPFDPPKAEAPKKEKGPAQKESTREGPSKKELNKLARKEKKKGGGPDSDATPSVEKAPAAPAATPAAPTTAPAPAVSKNGNPLSGVYFCNATPFVELSRYVNALQQGSLTFSPSANQSPPHQPFLAASGPGKCSISGDSNIARYLCRSTQSSLYCNGDPWLSSEVDQWLDLYTTLLDRDSSMVAAMLPAVLDTHLTDKSFMVGHSLSLADIAMTILFKKIDAAPFAHVSRWLSLIKAQLPTLPPLFQKNNAKDKEKAGAGGNSAGGKKKEGKAGGTAAAESGATDEGGSCPPLEGAVDGKVCTRFPPEPSGYLHIGHAKAVLLNQYYAQRYKGKLLVRFDDTNPSKEKDEFQENIIQDLATLGVKADKVSHTSDHFRKCEDMARKMITEGKAYMDDTAQEQMQQERMNHVESYRRNASVEDNLAMFEKLLKGDAEGAKYCMRAKIDMQSVNGTMRDPVMYRFNDTPHLRTGTQYKAYPTYDFACPIVDATEGVTHAMRTTEYNDREEQYYWLQNAMGLRKVNIFTFGKVNFVNTVLSKRKLNWFVEEKLVDGWFDPRFPTIQGCIRRGVNVEALKSFILGMGASKRIITMEWDKFWAENKKVLEESSARYMGVDSKDVVEFSVTNLPSIVEVVATQIHPQKPEMGTRALRRSNKLLVDQADAALYKEGEEVTFIRWGNFYIDKIIKDAEGKVLSMEGRAHPEATNFSKTKKVTWLASLPELVPCRLLEFDNIISKSKLEEDEDFKDFVNPHTKFEKQALCDPCVRVLPAGTVIQLERKGFFRIDEPYGGPNKPAVLFAIPDGKAKPSANAAPAPSKKKGGK